MSTSPRSHRLILALPVVLAMVALTLREGMSRAPLADVLAAPAMHIEPGTGAEYDQRDGIELRSGTVLVSTSGYATILADGATIGVWAGSAYVTLNNGNLTVAALDVPLAVHGTDDAIVMPGTQWKDGGSIGPLPAGFAEERLATVEPWRANVQTVRTPREEDALASLSVPELATHALAARPSNALFSALRAHAETRLLSLLHPATRDAAWTFLPENAFVQADIRRAVAALPDASRVGPAPTELTVRRWSEALAALGPDMPPSIAESIRALADRGQPLRAVRFAEAVRRAFPDEVSESLATLTPDALRATLLAEIAAANDVAADEETSVAEAVASDPALERRVRDLLAARGAMFTDDSTVTTVGGGEVEVKDVVFGLPSGDRALRFLFAEKDASVRAIVDGSPVPNAVPLEAYLEWEATR